MEEALREIACKMRCGQTLTHRELDAILRRHSKDLDDPSRRISKKQMLSFYQAQKQERSSLIASLRLDDATDDALMRLLRAKPRRTASGVATVTVLTKPWPCRNDCIYCPNDISMPKSYIADEPACQRAERCFFDPYLQVSARLTTLANMGHNIDKVELIVLGGTWFDYPASYRTWFSCELFRALDDAGTERALAEVRRRRRLYEDAREPFAAQIQALQDELQHSVDAGMMDYRCAFQALDPLRQAALPQLDEDVSEEELARLQHANEHAHARCVGLVVETRPDTVSVQTLTELRHMGVTKVQVGIQSLDDAILAQNGRGGSVDEVARALALIRLFGFKSHVHMMANLMGSTPEDDVRLYRMLMEDERFMPDEVKLYPCALVASARLTEGFQAGRWQPYGEEELVGLLSACVLATPEHTRISRMIRDIPSQDIVTGCKKTNLRQMVEADVCQKAGERAVREMRMREVATSAIDPATLTLRASAYDTANTREIFLQWVDGEDRLAGFLRLSLPDGAALSEGVPVGEGQAMIREVHIYGRTSKIHEAKEGNQHLGLGTRLVERACQLAGDAGYDAVNVISAVGTRAYYRRLGFEDAGLYQRRPLRSSTEGR